MHTQPISITTGCWDSPERTVISCLPVVGSIAFLFNTKELFSEFDRHQQKAIKSLEHRVEIAQDLNKPRSGEQLVAGAQRGIEVLEAEKEKLVKELETFPSFEERDGVLFLESDDNPETRQKILAWQEKWDALKKELETLAAGIQKANVKIEQEGAKIREVCNKSKEIVAKTKVDEKYLIKTYQKGVRFNIYGLTSAFLCGIVCTIAAIAYKVFVDYTFILFLSFQGVLSLYNIYTLRQSDIKLRKEMASRLVDN